MVAKTLLILVVLSLLIAENFRTVRDVINNVEVTL